MAPWQRWRWQWPDLRKVDVFIDILLSCLPHLVIIALTVPPDPPDLGGVCYYQVLRTTNTIVLETQGSSTGQGDVC